MKCAEYVKKIHQLQSFLSTINILLIFSYSPTFNTICVVTYADGSYVYWSNFDVVRWQWSGKSGKTNSLHFPNNAFVRGGPAFVLNDNIIFKRNLIKYPHFEGRLLWWSHIKTIYKASSLKDQKWPFGTSTRIGIHI